MTQYLIAETVLYTVDAATEQEALDAHAAGHSSETDNEAAKIVGSSNATPNVDTGTTCQTWTFFGHWEDDRIVVEWSTPGVHEDTREETGQWAEGLWAASGSGTTVSEAKTAAVAEYEQAAR